ncbi:BREX-1 system adenine-specific DNA-methyltransferase PglX [Candidatus Saccharibacteria bacterium]|nr:BREX-1 system adenine-specific DNA-methyltransferase PglX [Candidatus Saccharibacteria bacterium]
MDKNALKSFAMDAREKLTNLMKVKLQDLHIEEDLHFTQHGDLYENTEHVLRAMSASDYERYNKLKSAVSRDGIKAIIEKSAYTWFNRIVAIRYMEVNNFLPLGPNFESLDIKVLCDKSGKDFRNPEIMTMSKLRETSLDIDYAKLTEMNDQEKYKTIILAVVKKLGEAIPDVFDGDTENIDGLIPNNLLTPDGLNDRILRLGEEQFKHTEIIGWLYQYYNQAEKDRAMKLKTPTTKEDIPYVTQIFTPDWVVKYLVENSLGRYWLDRHPNKTLESKWEYLVKKKEESETIHDNRKIEDITFIDPCSGSGHILIYAFEVFYQIYESEGYPKSEIPELILNNNLYGLDIDDRANQLSILSCMLIARKYDDRIFAKSIKQHILSIHESNKVNLSTFSPSGEAKDILDYLMTTFRDAKEYGSILKIRSLNYDALRDAIKSDSIATTFGVNRELEPLIAQAEILSKKFTIAVTNPPYMNKYNTKLKHYINDYYPDENANMSSVFMSQCIYLTTNNGLIAMITPDAWMFLTSYEKFRKEIVENYSITGMLHLGAGIFEGIGLVVIPTAFIIEKRRGNYGFYVRLIDEKPSDKNKIAKDILNEDKENKGFWNKSESYSSLPGYIIAYWSPVKINTIMSTSKQLNNLAIIKKGLDSSDNNRFLREWWEVDYSKEKLTSTSQEESKLSTAKWFPHNKGGQYRKWYGNNDYVINWQNDGYEVKHITKNGKISSYVRGSDYYFNPSITWSKISFNLAFRFKPAGHIFDSAGASIFCKEPDDLAYLQGILNTNVLSKIASYISPTISFEVGQISTYPIVESTDHRNTTVALVKENRLLSKDDWDDYETSWDFTAHPLFKYKTESNKLSDAFSAYEKHCEERFNNLKSNEEKLNEIAIELYGLQDELTPDVPDDRITVRKADHAREARSFLSYFVGCVMGRYSTDKPGIQYAGPGTELPENDTVDSDGIITIMDHDSIGRDDIMNKLRHFLESDFGSSTLSTNLDWLAEGLGRKNTENSEDVIRNYFVNEFFNNHAHEIYADPTKKSDGRPIYWQISSGKHNAFKALFYIHRYTPSLMAKVRVDYVTPIMNYYDHRLAEIKTELQSASGMKRGELLTEQSDLADKLDEIKEFDKLLKNIADKRIELDLDDGIKRNYIKLSYAATDVKKGAHILNDVLKDKPLKDAIKSEYGDF